MHQHRLAIERLLRAAEENIRAARDLLKNDHRESGETVVEKDSTVLETIEGLYDGMHLRGSQGQVINVPANYASKSKLVEGDALKATVFADGRTLFKQIGPVERKSLIGTVVRLEDGTVLVDCQGQFFRFLDASMTFYKLVPGDKISVHVPRDIDGTWAAVDSVITRAEGPR